MPIVSIPGKNMRVRFPDDMSPEQIEQAIQQEIYGPGKEPTGPAPETPERTDFIRHPMPEPPTNAQPERTDFIRQPMPEAPERTDFIRQPMPEPPEGVQQPAEEHASPVTETIKQAAAYVPFLAVKALHGATGWVFEPFQKIPTEKLTPMQRATVEALGGAEEVMETAVEWWKKQTGDLDVKIPDVTIGRNPDGTLAIKPTESSARDIAERTAGLAGEALGPINASLTGGQLVAETLSKHARPFFRSIVSGMTAGALLGEGDKDQTLQNMALFGVLEPLAYTVGNVPRIAKRIRESTTWKKANTTERGLMLQSLEETIQRYPNLTEAEILRRWNNPQWREEALARRRVTRPEEGAPPAPPSGPEAPPASPVRPREGTPPAPPARPETPPVPPIRPREGAPPAPPVRQETPAPPVAPVRPETPPAQAVRPEVPTPPAPETPIRAEEPVVEQEVWHGTPYVWKPEPEFPHGRPRLDMIGKGEGGAAYGWGWYSVDRPETAALYQESLSRSLLIDTDVVPVNIDALTDYLKTKGISEDTARAFAFQTVASGEFPRNAFEAVRKAGTLKPEEAPILQDIAETMEFSPREWTLRVPGGLKTESKMSYEDRVAYYEVQGRAYWYRHLPDPIGRVKEDLEKTIKVQKETPAKYRRPDADEIIRMAQQELEFIEKYKPYPFEPQIGSLYRLDIPDDVVPKLLDWDAPLAEQPEHVKQAMEPALNLVSIDPKSATGGDLYEALSKRLGSDQAASEYLNALGIPGNTHGGMSRGVTGTKYVIWDQPTLDRVALLERNKKKLEAIQAAERRAPEFQAKTPAQRDVTSAVDTYQNDLVSTKTKQPIGREGAGIQTVANAITTEFKRTGRIDLRGRTARTTAELAVLAQIFRDPRVESFRIFYIDDAGRILSHEGVSSRMPDSTVPFITNHYRGVAEMAHKMQRLGATGYYFLHNHPSGRPEPSRADIELTKWLAKRVPGFKGHVIINSGKYAVLQMRPGDDKLYQVTRKIPDLPVNWVDKLLMPSVMHPQMGRYIEDAKDIAAIGEAVKRPENYTTLIFRSSTGLVRAIQNVPNGLLRNTQQGTGYIANRAREFGSGQVFAYFESPDLSSVMDTYIENGTLLDALSKGSPTSFMEQGARSAPGYRFGRKTTPAAIRVAEEWKPIPEGQRRSSVLKKLSDTLGVPIRIGKFRTRRGAFRVKGIYKQQARVIRLANANDLETALHEVGHHIETLLGLPTKMPESIRALAYKGAKDIDREGFAEFVRLYVMAPAAARGANPEFTAMFEEALKMHPEVRDVLIEAKQAWKTWQQSDAVAKVASFIQRGDKRGRMPSMNQVYTTVKDALYPLKQATDIAKELRGGRELDPSKDPYVMARLTRGWARVAEQFLKYQPFRYDPEHGAVFYGDVWPLNEILRPVDEAGELDLLDTYLVAKRASHDERIVKGFKGSLTQEDFDQIVTELEPKFKETAEKLYKYSDALLTFLVDSGRISASLADAIRKANMFYAPLYRVLDWEPPMGGLSSRNFSKLFNPIKRLRGSPRDIYSPTENLVYNTYVMVNIAQRNRVGDALIELSKTPGIGRIIEQIPPRIKPVKMTTQEALDSMVRGIEDPDEREVMKQLLASFSNDVLNEMVVTFRPDYTPRANEALFYKNGKPILFELDPQLARAISNISAADLDLLVKIAAFPAQVLRAGATTYSPTFPLWNLQRDQLTAFIQSEYGFIPVFDFVRGLFHILGQTRTWQLYNVSGAAHATNVSIDRNYMSKNLKDLLERGSVKGMVKHPFDFIQSLSEVAEEATRVGEFALAQKKLGPGYESLLRSGIAGRKITVDFARQGEATARSINLLSAFWNARLEGLDTMVQTFRRNPVRASILAYLGVTVPSLLLWYAQKDDPYYQELPLWRRVMFWNIIIRNDDGSLNRIIPIPKPMEYGLLFGTIPEMALDWAYTKDPEGFKEAAAGIVKALQLFPIPTGLIPIAEWWSGKSWFFDRPIVPRSVEGVEPVLQYGPHTSKTMRIVAEAMDKIPGLREVASPAKLENLIRGYTAGAGGLALFAGDYLIEAFDLGDMPKAPARGAADIPGLRAFSVRFPTANTRSIETFYKRYHKMNVEWESARHRIGISGTGIRADAPPMLQYYSQAASAMTAIRKIIEITYENDSLTPEEKRQALDNLYIAMINIARSALAKKPLPAEGGR